MHVEKTKKSTMHRETNLLTKNIVSFSSKKNVVFLLLLKDILIWSGLIGLFGVPFYTKEKPPLHESSNKALVGHEALSIYWLSNLPCFIQVLFAVLFFWIIWWFILMEQKKNDISPSILDNY